MSRRVCFLLLLLPLLASAQLQIFLAPQNSTETAIGASLDLGTTSLGDSTSVRLRIRNTGQATLTLTQLIVAGSGFSMSGAPSLPFLVAPGNNVDFTVRFSPTGSGSYSANLQMNNTSVILRATGLPGVSVSVNGNDLASGAQIDLGRTERDTGTTITVRLSNPGKDAANVQSIAVTGAGFSLSSVLTLPMVVGSGQTVDFVLAFNPTVSGIAQGSLTIDKRSFVLTGTAYEPQLPRPSVILETPVLHSGDQGRVSVRLASPSRSAVKGQLRMELRPAGQIRDNDASAMFLSGSRTLAFDINPGDQVIKLRGESSTAFQAGTTAGTLVFTIEAGGFTDQVSTVIAADVVHVDKAAAVRTASGVELTISGFDNTRSVGDLSFTFYSPDGQPLAGMPIKVNAGSDFGTWWSASTVGGVFQLRAVFPIAGDASKVTAVQASAGNSAGSATTDKLSF